VRPLVDDRYGIDTSALNAKIVLVTTAILVQTGHDTKPPLFTLSSTNGHESEMNAYITEVYINIIMSHDAVFMTQKTYLFQFSSLNI